MYKEKIAVMIGTKLWEKIKEKVTEEGKKQAKQLIDEKIKESTIEVYKRNLNENLLKKYGDEKFYTELCNVLLSNQNLDKLIKRCEQRDIIDDETNEEFLEKIMKDARMTVYDKAMVKKVLVHIEGVTYKSFNILQNPDSVKLQNAIIRDGEQTRKEIERIQRDIYDALVKKENVSCENVNRYGTFISKSCKKEVAHFKGREKELKELEELLKENKGIKTFLWIYGMGGLGKTQLCRRFCSIIENQYAYIGWVSYQNNFKQSLVNSIYMLDKTGDLDKDYENAVKYINSLGRELILFIDNYDLPDTSISDIEALQCNVIVTSRNKNPDTFIGYQLGFLDFTSCKKLFQHFYTLEDNLIMNEIIHKTGYLSLAVELLAKTGQKLGLSLEEYYMKLEEKGFDIRTVIQSNWDNHGEKLNVELSRHFNIVFDLTAFKENTEAMYILKNFSVLPYLGVTQREIVSWLALDEENNYLSNLVESGWLQIMDLEYTMHPIISFTVKNTIVPALTDCLNMLIALSACIRVEQGDNYLRSFYYLPYAESVGKYFLKNNQVLNGDDERLFILYIRIAEINRHNGDYEKAYEWGKESYRGLNRIAEVSGIAVNLVCNVMSEICLDMRNRNEECRDWALLAIESDKKRMDVKDIERGTSYHNLAGAYIQMKQNEEALDYEMKALELRKNHLPEKDTRIINCYRNIAMIHRRLGNIDTAFLYQKMVVETLEELYVNDKNHPDFPVAYSLFSFILRDLGKIGEAIDYQKKAAMIREVVNENDPKLAINYNNLGIFCLQNNNLQEAIQWQEKAIEMDIKNRGPNHPDVAVDFFNYAKILYAAGKKNEAIQYLMESRRIEEKDKSHPENIKEIDELLYKYTKDDKKI